MLPQIKYYIQSLFSFVDYIWSFGTSCIYCKDKDATLEIWNGSIQTEKNVKGHMPSLNKEKDFLINVFCILLLSSKAFIIIGDSQIGMKKRKL